MKNKSIFLTAGIFAATFFFAPSTWAKPVIPAQLGDTEQAEGNERGRKRQGKSGEKMNPEKLMEQFDQDGDGQLAVSELSGRMEKQFTKMDTDQNGFVTAEELETFQNRGGKGKGKGKGDRKKGKKNVDPATFMQQLDKDGNQKISLTEAPKRIKAVFAQADTNADGSIDLAELTVAMESLEGMSGGKADRKKGKKNVDPAKFMQQLDKDGDQKISLTEAPKRIKAVFAQADTNADGSIDLAELTVAMESLEGKGGKKGKGDKKGKRNRGKEKGQRPDTGL